jgi:hypothetical protein
MIAMRTNVGHAVIRIAHFSFSRRVSVRGYFRSVKQIFAMHKTGFCLRTVAEALAQ